MIALVAKIRFHIRHENCVMIIQRNVEYGLRINNAIDMGLPAIFQNIIPTDYY